MPAGYRYDDDGERVAAYRLPCWMGYHVTNERALEAMNAQRAAYARAAQEEHGLTKTMRHSIWWGHNRHGHIIWRHERLVFRLCSRVCAHYALQPSSLSA